MKSKSFIFLIVLVFMIVFSLSAVSADDLQTNDSGQVSGDVNVVTVNPWDTTGELTYDIPSEATDIKSADVYVNVYAGSAKNTYGANANVTLKTVKGENQIASEELWIENGTSDGTVYPLNNHTDKCYSDYQMRYDITDSLKGLNGSAITLKVDTFKMENKTFDGRIKLIALVLAYNDGDDDEISYWIDSAQKWAKTNVTTTFNTESTANIGRAELTNVVLSSGDGNYTVNGELLGNATKHESGNYYQYNCWDVKDKIKEAQNTELKTIYAGSSAYGSIKNVLSVLKIDNLAVDISLATEYTYAPTAYAGTNNTLTVKVKSNKSGSYLVELAADGKVVNTTVVELDGENETTLLLTDPTIRPIDETTVSGANNTEVEYAVTVSLDGLDVNTVSKTFPVLYNGYLGKDLEYDAEYIEEISFYQITGGVTSLYKDDTTYMAAGALNRTDVFSLDFGDNLSIAKAFVYLAYNWDKSGENGPEFNVTFNGNQITPKSKFRDQSNIGSSGKYGYGLFVYDVTDLAQYGENNTLFISKPAGLTAVYPSNLVLLLNDSQVSQPRYVYLLDGADLLANSYNNAGRIVKTDNPLLSFNPYIEADVYIFAASAQKGEGNIIINDKEYTDVWSGSSYSLEGYYAELDKDNYENNISFVATGSTILALNQIVTIIPIMADVSLATEYTSVPTAYAGTNNTLTIKVKANAPGNYTVILSADGDAVNVTEVELDGENETTILLTDPTIRPVDETTVNGANNTYVNYVAVVTLDYDAVGYNNLKVPVLYNGNLGNDYEYEIAGFEPFSNTPLITGDVVIDVQDVSTYLGASAMNRTDVWTVNLTQDSEIVDAYIFVPYNWFNAKLYNETEDMFDITFNGQEIVPVAYYRDQGNLGNYGKYGYGVLIYSVDNLINSTGDNTLVLNKKNPTPAVYPSALVYTYNTPGGSIKEVSIVSAADLLSNSNNNAGRIVKSDSVINLTQTGFENATLYVLAASAQKGESNIVVNGKVFEDVWSGTSSTTDLFTADITDVLADSNNISFVATGSTILALPQIIVADTGVVLSIDSIKTEYTSVPTAFADSSNLITATITTNKEGEFTVVLLANLSPVDEKEVNLTNGTHEIELYDFTIRPADETTVNGADNKNVTYTVGLVYGDYTILDSITVPLLYNGYFSKIFEYNATYIEDVENYTVSGGVKVDTKDDSTYMSTSALNRTDVWNIDLSDDQPLVNAFVYLAYNWDKTGENGPALNVTFNGNAITPRSTYRDQGNLGKYGKYGYGLYIYDVSEFAQTGNNTLFISKEKGMTALYPSSLIYLYNDDESRTVTTVYMANGADLLSNDYNGAERIIMTDSVLDVDTKDVAAAQLYVFAASAQKNEGNILFNSYISGNVWNGSSNSLGMFSEDITEYLLASNKISFISTGSTILALNQMIVTTSKEIPDVVIDVPDQVKPGADIVATINIANATGGIIVLIDDEEPIPLPLAEDGSASMLLFNVTAGIHGISVLYPGDDTYLSGVGLKVFEAVPVTTEFTDIVINEDSNITLVLKDESGNPISDAVITYVINGTVNMTNTAADGSFVIPAVDGVAIDIIYDGNVAVLGTNTTITYNVPAAPTVVKVVSHFNITDRAITINGYAVDGPAGEQGIYYATSLLDENNNPISNVYIEFAVNNKIYNRTTYENGSFAPYKLNMVRAGRYTMAFNFAGDDNYTNAFACVCVDLDKKPIKIKASAKTYKASTKTKKYTVTLSTIKGLDGKMYLSPKKVSLKVNGKTFTAKTNSKGQATFKITNLSKKAKYKAEISFDGDKTYEAATKTVTLKVK